MADFNLNVSASELNAAIAKANAAAPQSTTYTKPQVDATIAAETASRQAAEIAMQTSISDMQSFLTGKKVYEHYFGSTSGSDTFTISKSDFGSGNISNCGVYLIYRISWATTPSISIYALAYSGNHEDYTALQKIAGDDFDISVTQDVLSFTTAGKIQIIAVT